MQEGCRSCATNGVGSGFSPIFLPMDWRAFDNIDCRRLDWFTSREQVKRYGTPLAGTAVAAFLNRASHVRIMPGAP
jgi:hypothetical protein